MDGRVRSPPGRTPVCGWREKDGESIHCVMETEQSLGRRKAIAQSHTKDTFDHEYEGA